MRSGVANRRERILYREVLPALVSQLAEETDSKPVQCEFESHRGHSPATGVCACRRILGVEHHCELTCRGHILATLAATDDRSESKSPGLNVAFSTLGDNNKVTAGALLNGGPLAIAGVIGRSGVTVTQTTTGIKLG